MAKSPKMSPNWNIAATHFLTSGFAMPLLVTILAGLAFGSTVTDKPFIQLGISLVGITLGTMYSANYLKKTYVINDAEKISKLTAVYNAVLYAVLISLSLFASHSFGESFGNIGLVVLGIFSSIILYYVTVKMLSPKK